MALLDKLTRKNSPLKIQPSVAETDKPETSKVTIGIGATVAILLAILYIVTWYWSLEPSIFNVEKKAIKAAKVQNVQNLASGYTYSNTLIVIAETLLNKNGGFVSNDLFPGMIMDNMPSWEIGALVMLRDATSSLRNDFARSQSQSKENFDLSKAEPFLYYDNESWIFPSSEAEYRKGIKHLMKYRNDLANKKSTRAKFYARADNLRLYLEVIEKRLGSLSHRLSASTIQKRQEQISPGKMVMVKTPWLEVDDIFFEARGATWALYHIFKAIETDFNESLDNKQALATLRQIIQEFEDAQATLFSPVILNGDGFGIFANYSLTMANYITRANAATIDLRNLLLRG